MIDEHTESRGTLVPIAQVYPWHATVRLEWVSVLAAHNAKPGPLCSLTAALAEIARLEAEHDALKLSMEALVDLTRDSSEQLRQERDEARARVARYDFVAGLQCNSFTLSLDGDHACNYMSASDWIDEHPDWFGETDAAEIQRMREMGHIWSLQIYPDTPIGSYSFYAASADAVVDAAISSKLFKSAQPAPLKPEPKP